MALNCIRKIDLLSFITFFCLNNGELILLRSNLICKAPAYDIGYVRTAVKSEHYLLHKKPLALGYGDIAPRGKEGWMTETE